VTCACGAFVRVACACACVRTRVCFMCVCLLLMMICLPPRDTSPHQDSAGTAPSGTPPPVQPPLPPQKRRTQSHSARTPLKRPVLTPEGVCVDSASCVQDAMAHGQDRPLAGDVCVCDMCVTCACVCVRACVCHVMCVCLRCVLTQDRVYRMQWHTAKTDLWAPNAHESPVADTALHRPERFLLHRGHPQV